MIVEGTNISMIRGDTEHITVKLAEDGESVPFEEGDILYFTVKYNTSQEEKLLQKVITEFEDGEAIIEIAPDDTKELPFRTYIYDMQLTRKDGTVTTIIPPSRFTIKGEVTYE